MEPTTRRSFLVKSSAGAVGAAGVFGAGWALSSKSDESPLSAEELEEIDGQALVVNVTDAAAGEVEVLVGEREVQLTDKSLVARVLRATR